MYRNLHSICSSLLCLSLIATESVTTTGDSRNPTPEPNPTAPQLQGICSSKNCQNLCNSPKVDSVLNYKNGTTFAFKGNFFWHVMDRTTPPDESNRRLIKDYWNPNGRAIFTGPIDAAFVDNHGFTYFFKGNTIYTFKDFTFVRSQRVMAFESIDSAVVVDAVRSDDSSERCRRVFLFQGIYFWIILPMDRNYDWNEVFAIFKRQRVDKIHPKFPFNIDAAFEDKDHIVVIKGNKYMRIPSENFVNAIQDKDLRQKFIYKDVLNCDDKFYERTKFFSYDQFLIELISTQFDTNHMKEQSGVHCQKQHGCFSNTRGRPQDPSLSKWIHIMIGMAVGIVVTLVFAYLVRFLCFAPKDKRLYTYSKRSGIDFFGRNDLNDSVVATEL